MKLENEIGMLYIAFGRPYLAMALVSCRSARETNPEIPICIITNVCEKGRMKHLHGWREGFDVWIYLEIDTPENRNIKTQLYRYTPFDKTLYLDSDTIVVGDVSRSSIFLNYFDVCLKLNRTEQKKPGRTNTMVLDGNAAINELPHWNGGVIFFKNSPEANHFFDLWHKFYQIHENKYDQVSLVEALFRSDCRILSLDSRWNYKRKHKFLPVRKNVKILHYVTDRSLRETPRIHDGIIQKILAASQKIPGGEIPENVADMKAFFRRINDFRSRGSLIHIIRNEIRKRFGGK